MPGGPKTMTRTRRLELAHEIAERIQHHYGDRVLAIGVYGSVARGTDGPYSDIEMHCVLHGTDFETALEWSAGSWKAEVNVCTEDVILQWASEVDVDWPLTHGSYVKVMSVSDPTDFFSRLGDTVLLQPDQTFQRVIHGVIVGELYERVGKIRNARASKNTSSLPYFVVEFAKFGAYLIGLANRHLYTSASHFFEESLTLPSRPDGYDALCQIVMAGELGDPARIADASDVFWSGVERWAQDRGIQIEEDLEALLNIEADGKPVLEKQEVHLLNDELQCHPR
jgi:kanamycin nucleotidyltransferase